MWVAPQRESAQFTQAHHHRHSNFQAIERGVGVAGRGEAVQVDSTFVDNSPSRPGADFLPASSGVLHKFNPPGLRDSHALA